MQRRQFIKGSAIIGASIAVPTLVTSGSGMYSSSTNRKVYHILDAEPARVGTLPIMRAFAGNHLDYVSPFVLFDEFGPVAIRPGNNPLRVDAHPHAGVTPTTYFLSGSGHHRDSLDYDFQVSTGEFMLFRSGRGAIHMEESGQKLMDEGGTLHGFQIWLNTPAKHKFDAPATDVYRSKDMPVLVKEQYTAKVVIGDLFGFRSGVETKTPAFYYYLNLKAGCRLDIPVKATHNAFIYAVSGKVELADRHALKTNQLALFERGQNTINLYSKDGAELFLLGGQPLNEPVYAFGPFVMNNEEQIHQCYADYEAGKMGDPDKVN